MERVAVKTSSRTQFIDITDKVEAAVSNIGIQEGICHVFVPHTTAAVTINENADPSVVRDIVDELNKIVPSEDGYRHGEGNSAAHIKSTLVGASETIFVSGGKLALGTWQGVYFCEFDGPRSRNALVTVSPAGAGEWKL